MQYEFFDYFTGKSLLMSDIPSTLDIYELVKVPDFEDVLMVYALNKKRHEGLLAPVQGGKSPLVYSFVENKLVCQRCRMTCPIGIFEEKDFRRHKKEWDRGLNLRHSVKIMQHIDETHQELCNLIRPNITLVN